MTTCDTCGAEIRIGDHPWCPHGRFRQGLQTDTFNASGQWVENLSGPGEGPVWVEGRSDMKRKAAERGLRWVPEGITTSKVRRYDDDMKGRFNGGALPTFREHHAPDQERAAGDPGAHET